MKVSAPHRGWTSGRATPSLRPTPYAAETANPAGRHLSFAEICPDNRSRLSLACIDLCYPPAAKCFPPAYRERDAAEESAKFIANLLISMVGAQGLEPLTR